MAVVIGYLTKEVKSRFGKNRGIIIFITSRELYGRIMTERQHVAAVKN